MTISSRTIYRDFNALINALKASKQNYELVFKQSLITKNDIEVAYAGLYVELFTSFEKLIYDLFVGMLDGTVKHNNIDHTVKVKIKPPEEVENVLTINSRGFTDWIPYDNTKKLALVFFSNGMPFTSLQKPEIKKIEEYHIIRNAMAHKSQKSANTFNSYISNYSLLPSEKNPSGFLRNIPSAHLGDNRFDIACDDILSFAKKICY